MDKVTVCIPVYNGSAFLQAALESALNQTYENCEFLVSDNGSTDESLEIIHSFQKTSGRPIQLFLDAPKGMVSNWNYLGFKATGRWLKYLFQDDVLDPRCVERMVSAAGPSDAVNLVFSKRRILLDDATTDEDLIYLSTRLSSLHRSTFPPRCRGSWYLGLRDLLWRENFIGEPSSVMIARSAFLSLNGFSNRWKQLVDYEMWVRCLALGDVAFLDEYLASFRVHEHQMTVVNSHEEGGAQSREWRELLQILATPHIFLQLHPKVRTEIRQKLAEDYVPAPAAAERLWTVASRVKGRLRKLTA